jgi:hypothetical protein
MGYLHIENLYASQHILLEPEVYALEKIHGTSAHIKLASGQLHFFSGEQQEAFEALFTPEHRELIAATLSHLGAEVTVFGEAYGGKIQRQQWRYGEHVRFVAFDVKAQGVWLNVPEAAAVAALCNLDFVSWKRIPTQLSLIDAERDAPSAQAIKLGVMPQPEDAETDAALSRLVPGGFRREGVVLRPLQEFVYPHRGRLIVKHKKAEERETKTPREVGANKLAEAQSAAAIADEWVTETRLDHVLQALQLCERRLVPQDIGLVVRGMLEDVNREGASEFTPSPATNRAIGTAAALFVKKRIAAQAAEEIGASNERSSQNTRAEALASISMSKVKSAVCAPGPRIPVLGAPAAWHCLLDCGHTVRVEQPRMPRSGDEQHCSLCVAEGLIDAT